MSNSTSTIFEKLDTDKNSEISSEEYQQMYKEIDLDGDSVLNLTETKFWVNQNLASICGEEREKLIEKTKKTQFNDAL